MKKVQYIEKEPLIAWLENMGVSKNIIDAIADESRFPVMSISKVDENNFPKNGDDIYYVDHELGEIEHGEIYLLDFGYNMLECIGVNFDNGDYDEFVGEALGRSLFLDKEMAINKLVSGK